MDCHQFREQILAFSEKELPSAVMAEMHQHAKGCTECSKLYSEFKTIAVLIEQERNIEPLPFAETRLLGKINARLDQQEIFTLPWKLKLQPAAIGLLVLAAIAFGLILGSEGVKQYSSNHAGEQQIESMRNDLNVPDFMDEDNTSLN